MKRIVISLAVVFFSQAVCVTQPSGKSVGAKGFVADQECQEEKDSALARCLSTTMHLSDKSHKVGAGALCLAGVYMKFVRCMQRNNPVVTK